MKENIEIDSNLLPTNEEGIIDENFNLVDKEETSKLKPFDIGEENVKEKEQLKLIFQNLNDELDKKDDKKDEEEDLIEENIEISEQLKKLKDGTDILTAFKNNREDKCYNWILFAIFSIALPLIVIINLIGIFQIISVMTVLFEVIKRSFLCYLDMEDKDDKSYYEFYNFYGFYIKSAVEEGIDYDLIETMSFLGTILVKFYGFSISSGIFMGLNILSLFLIINFHSDYEIFEKYTIGQILYLIICYLLLFVGVGSSALLSQQLLTDHFEQYSLFLYFNKYGKKKKNKNKEDEKIQEPYFILVCVTSILGFLIKYILDIVIYYKKHSFDEQFETEEISDSLFADTNTTDIGVNIEIFDHDKKLFYWIIAIYGISIILSIIGYKVFKMVYEGDEDNEDENKEKKEIRECNIFGYIIYLKEYNDKELRDEKKEKKEEKEEENEEEEAHIGYVTEVVTAPKIKKLPSGDIKVVKEYTKKKLNIKEKTCICLKKFCRKLCLCIKLLSDSFISWFNEIICPFFCCEKTCCCCCCCCECKEEKIKEDDYELNEGYFCYCYKAKKNVKWFNRFIRDETQKKIFPLLLQYFIIQLNTIAFEKIFEENNEDGSNEFNDSKSIGYFVFIFGLSLYIFFYFTSSFGYLYSFYLEGRKADMIKKNKSQLGESTEKISNRILNGTYGIIIFNGFYSLIVSSICLSKTVDNNYYFYVPILINKFYYFTFAHQCTTYTDKDDEINYFTVATLLSIYLEIWDFFINLLKQAPTNILLWIQLVLSTIIVIASLFTLVILLCFIGRFLFTLLYFLFFVPLGGCWFIGRYKKHNLSKYECPKFKNKDCLDKIWLTEKNLKRIKSRLIAE